MLNPIVSYSKEWVREHIKEWVLGALEGISEVLTETSYSIALIGGGIGILASLSGWKEGKKYTGILVLAHILIQALLGG